MAAEGVDLRLRVNEYQVLHRGPDAQPRRRQRPQAVEHVPHVQVPVPRHEAPREPLHAPVLQADLARGGVEAFAAAEGVALDVEGEVEEGGEAVGELDDADGGDDGDEAGEGGDGGADDEGEGPVEGDEGHPEQFAFLVGEGRGAEEFDGDVVVEDCRTKCQRELPRSTMRGRNELTLDPDVPIQTCRDQSADHSQDVARGLPVVGGNAEVRRVLEILALVCVHEQAVEHVADVDEELRSPHALQEVVRAFHLGHKFGKQHRTTVRVHGLHQTIDGRAKVGWVGKACRMGDRWEDTGGIGSHQVWIHAVTGRASSGRIQRRRVCGDTHGDEHNQEIDPHREIG